MSRMLPTVGRRVYYKPDPRKLYENDILSEQPFDAGILHVNIDGTVNVQVTSHTGFTETHCNVTLVEPGVEPDVGQCYWMPYQIAQAKG